MLKEFNRGKFEIGKSMKQPTQLEIQNTPTIIGATLEQARRLGGKVVNNALDLMKFDLSKNIIVDVKVHMLMKGMSPAIPGWHTDGVPRGVEQNPLSKGKPFMDYQEGKKPHKFHLFVTGNNCLTEFIKDRNLALEVPDEPDTDLYKAVSKQVNKLKREGKIETFDIPSCTVVTWDWWELHTGKPTSGFEWRVLIRVTETEDEHYNFIKEDKELYRLHNNVYIPVEFGW